MQIVIVHNTYREAGGEDVVFENENVYFSATGTA